MNLFKRKSDGRFLLLLVFFFTSLLNFSINGPVTDDRTRKINDSTLIDKYIQKYQSFNYEENELYTTWNTSYVHCYHGVDLPDSFKIDLSNYSMPTPSRVVTSGYGYRASFGRMHKGIDIKVYIGDTISSAFDGKVRIVNYEPKGYGNYVVIRHKNGLETVYGHLSKHLCKVGDEVKSGQAIGLGGNTGRSTGSHLHFETRLLGEAINPAKMFDFPNQKVTGDYFTFYETKEKSEYLAAATPVKKTTYHKSSYHKTYYSSKSKHYHKRR